MGVADPSPLRREQTAKRFNLEPSCCFESADELAKQPKLADFVINGTMDHQHVATALPLLEKGYHMLLEKPFAKVCYCYARKYMVLSQKKKPN